MVICIKYIQIVPYDNVQTADTLISVGIQND